MSDKAGQLTPYERIRRDCWDQALYAFATAVMYDRRARRLRRKIRLLQYLAVGVPLIAGTLFLAVGSKSEYLSGIIAAASILGVVQALLFVWSLGEKWEDTYAGDIEGKAANESLRRSYEILAKNPPATETEFRRLWEMVEVEKRVREAIDNKALIDDKDKRAGHRAALHQFQVPCVTCKTIPADPTLASECPTCGNF